MFRFVLDHEQIAPLVTAPEITSLIFWSDNGPHFHSRNFLYYPLVEAINTSSLGLDRVEVNFLVAFHGKSDVDEHFSNIGFMVDHASKHWKEGVLTTYDVVEAIKEGTAFAQQSRKETAAKSRSLRPNVHDSGRMVESVVINLDIEKMPDYIREMLMRPRQIECKLMIELVSVVTHIVVERDEEDSKKYDSFRADGCYWEEIGDRKLLRAFGENENAFKRMLKANRNTEYEFKMKTKPWPWSPDEEYMVINPVLIVDKRPGFKLAPDKPDRVHKAAQLKVLDERRDRLFGGGGRRKKVAAQVAAEEKDNDSNGHSDDMDMDRSPGPAPHSNHNRKRNPSVNSIDEFIASDDQSEDVQLNVYDGVGDV